jgi:sulfopyruvate decarboxylase TPP-binding subunit
MRFIEMPNHVPDVPDISNDAVRKILEESGIKYLVTLPESPYEVLLKDLVNKQSIKIIQVCRESEAMGICSGLTYGGKKTALLCSFKGLYNAIDSLIGVAIRTESSFLMLISDGNAPMRKAHTETEGGIFTTEFLKVMGIPYFVVESDADLHYISEALEQTKNSTKPVAVVLRW